MHTVIKSEAYPCRLEPDVVKIRQTVRQMAVQLGFSLVDQTKIVTAASELARNTVIHGGGGDARLEIVDNGIKKGVQLVFIDTGPGIENIELALQDGFTSKSGMGLGLPGSKRLSHEFNIDTTPGKGTTVTIVRWK